MESNELKWKRLKPKYKALAFLLFLVGLGVCFTSLWILQGVLAEAWSVDVTVPNCKDSSQCMSLAWVMLIVFPFALGGGVLVSVSLVGGFITKIGARAALDAFIFSNFPESWL